VEAVVWTPRPDVGRAVSVRGWTIGIPVPRWASSVSICIGAGSGYVEPIRKGFQWIKGGTE